MILPLETLSPRLKSLTLCISDNFAFSNLNMLPPDMETLEVKIYFERAVDKDITDFIEMLPVGLKSLTLVIHMAPGVCWIDINRLPPRLKHFCLGFRDFNPYNDDGEVSAIMIAPIYYIKKACCYSIHQDVIPRFTPNYQ